MGLKRKPPPGNIRRVRSTMNQIIPLPFPVARIRGGRDLPPSIRL